MPLLGLPQRPHVSADLRCVFLLRRQPCRRPEESPAVVQAVFENFAPRHHVQKVQQEMEEMLSTCEIEQARYRAAAIQLEAQVINAACDNPGLAVTYDLILPLLRERLYAKVSHAQAKEDQAAAQVLSSVSI